jgi:hypothetical protein
MRVIHDWGDERATKILQNCHSVIWENGRVLVIERLIEIGGGADPQALMTLSNDLVMLVLGGGNDARERSAEEFRALFRAPDSSLRVRSQLVPATSSSRGSPHRGMEARPERCGLTYSKGADVHGHGVYRKLPIRAFASASHSSSSGMAGRAFPAHRYQ